MKTFLKVVDWFAYSSVNSAKLSLTLKAGGTAVVLILGFLGVSNGEVVFNQAVDSLILVVTGIGSIIAGGIGIYGFGRKTYLTVFKK